MEPWNLWMYLFCSLAAVCLCLVWIVPTARGRGPRAVGLGAALVPVAALYVLGFGVTVPSWMFQVTIIFDTGRRVVSSGGSVLPATSQLAAFWLSVAIVVAAAVLTLAASRQAAYLAAVSLMVFGLWQMYVAAKLQGRSTASWQ